MSSDKSKSEAKDSNPWFWIGLSVCVIVALSKPGRENGSSTSRKAREEARRNALAIENRERVSPLPEFVVPAPAFPIPPIEGHELDDIRTSLVINGDDDDDDDDDAPAKNRSGKRSSGDRTIVIHENQRASEELGALSKQLKANAANLSEDKMRELERKIAEAGEKLREAAEKTGAKISERSREVIVSRILGEKVVPAVPPVPPVPGGPEVPSINEVKSKPEPPKVAKFQVRSGPCATREKSIAEVRENLNKIVSSRLTEFGLKDPIFARKAMESLKPKIEVEESFREVGGDRYPLYVASVNVDLGTNFERQALRLVNQQTAHQRFAGLMGLSFGVVALLVGIDRLVLGRYGKPAESGKSLV